MPINKLQIKNFLGIKEFSMEPGKVNLIQGANGKGKTSILEALEKGFTNNDRRPRVIRDGADQALILIETDDLNIRRSITPKNGTLAVKNKEGFNAPKPQTLLSALVGTFSFNPVDFLLKDEGAQTKILLSVAPLTITPNDVFAWTGGNHPVDYSQHGLKVCRDLHDLYYDKRKDVNAEVKAAKNEVESIKLPAGFNPESYRNVSLRDLYGELEEARINNTAIQAAEQNVKDADEELSRIEVDTDIKRGRVAAKTKDDLQDIEAHTVQQVNELRNKATEKRASLQVKIAELEAALKTARDELAGIDTHLQERIESLQAKKEESIKAIMAAESHAVNELKERHDQAIAEVTSRRDVAQEVLAELSLIDLAPLETRVKEHEEMKSYVRDYDRKVEAEARLAERIAEAKRLDDVVKLLAAKPAELIKQAKLPVDGLGIDEKGNVTINGLPIKNRSGAEKIALALDIARATCGPLKVICVDGLEALDARNQAELMKQIEGDDFQYFITVVGDADLMVKAG